MNNREFNIRIEADHTLLLDIERFRLETGKITFLLGESGIGKTLISKALYGLLDSEPWEVQINGQPYYRYLKEGPVGRWQRDGFFVFQEPSSHLNPLLTIEQQLNEGDLAGNSYEPNILRRLWQNVAYKEIEDILKVFPKPFRPSGGEKQRVLLSMAFKKMQHFRPQKETLYIFDEPTGNLDDVYRNQVVAFLLEEYRKNPFTILFITHDYSLINELYRNHGDVLPQMRFKELQRVAENQLELKKFDTDGYLKWLEKAHPLQSGSLTGRKSLLTVEPQFKVFDRSFRIFADASHTRPAPLKVLSGKITYLKAPSGVGKTTLAKIIMGLIPAQQVHFELGALSFTEQTGRMRWQKQVWGKRAGMVFQHAEEALDLRSTVRQIFKGLPVQQKMTRNRVLKELSFIFEAPLQNTLLQRQVFHLSGGQKQRLNLLRTFILNVDLIILDEPLNGLDFNSIQRVLKMIQRKLNDGKGFLLISHNEEIFDRFIPEELQYYLWFQ